MAALREQPSIRLYPVIIIITIQTILFFLVPAYGLRSLSNNEGGVSGLVHALVSEGGWVVHSGLLRSDR